MNRKMLAKARKTEERCSHGGEVMQRGQAADKDCLVHWQTCMWLHCNSHGL